MRQIGELMTVLDKYVFWLSSVVVFWCIFLMKLYLIVFMFKVQIYFLVCSPEAVVTVDVVAAKDLLGQGRRYLDVR